MHHDCRQFDLVNIQNYDVYGHWDEFMKYHSPSPYAPIMVTYYYTHVITCMLHKLI